jgi:hypothetical protein
MARDGVFTQLIYEAQGVTAKEIARMPMIIGPAVHALDEKYLFSWDGEVTDILNTNTVIKPNVDCAITAVADLVMSIDTPDGIKVMNATNFAAAVGATNVTNYNLDNGTSVVNFPTGSSLYKIIAGNASNIVPATGIVPATAAQLLVVKVGQVVTAVGGAFAEITAVGTDTFTIDMINGTLVEDDVVSYIYYDCTGFQNKLDDAQATHKVRSPKVYVTMAANQTGIKGIHTITSIGKLVEMFGMEALSNRNSILPYHANLALLANGGATAIKVYVMETIATELATVTMDDFAKHGIAQGKISGTDAYFIVPVTTSASVMSSYKTHVESLSSTDKKKERRLYIARRIFNGGDMPTGYETVGNDNYGEKYINFSGSDPSDDVDIATGVPGGYASERVTVMPYYAYLDNTLLIGSEVAAVVAGYRSGLPLGYVTTLDSVPLITGVPSVDYYSVQNLEDLKNAGWYMLVQDKVGSPAYCYHQMTTEQEILEKKEESLVVAVDAMAMSVRETMRPFIARGLSNRISGVNPDAPISVRYLKKVAAACAGIRYLFVTQKEIFADMKVVGLAVNDTNRDQVDVKIEVSHLYPANRINVAIHIV